MLFLYISKMGPRFGFFYAILQENDFTFDEFFLIIFFYI
jgi:hypothetical protein